MYFGYLRGGGVSRDCFSGFDGVAAEFPARRVEFHAARLYFLQSRMTTCDAMNPAPPVIRMCRSKPLP